MNITVQGQTYRKMASQYITGEPYINYYSKYDGSPFYDGDWVKGSLILTSGEEYKNIDIKLDLFKNQLVYFNDVYSSLVVIDNKIIDHFSVTNKLNEHETFIKYKTYYMGQLTDRFYSLLVEDSIDLVVSYPIILHTYSNASPKDSKIGKFTCRKRYSYIINHELYNIPKSKYRLLKSFMNIRTQLNFYIRQNHLKLRKQDDLILIFKEINRLNSIQ